MPLVKEVCKRCMNGSETPWHHWNRHDDSAWREGWVNCPWVPERTKLPQANDEVPRYCRYSVEQVVLGEGK